MNNTKQATHTPGPWEVIDRNAHGDLWVGPKNDPAILSNGTSIVMVRDLPFSLTDEQVMANARLIAAAPDLLKMLREAVSHDNALKPEWKVPPRLLADMQAAIAKATA